MMRKRYSVLAGSVLVGAAAAGLGIGIWAAIPGGSPSRARDTVRATVPVLEKMPADGGWTTCRVVGFSPSGYGGQPYRKSLPAVIRVISLPPD
jgi:hypothetical protein